MELCKKTIHMNYEKANLRHIITIDEDINVPDSKADILEKIKEKGEAVVDKLRNEEGQSEVSGKLVYNLLYSADNGLASLGGSVDYAETIKLVDACASDIVNCCVTLLDISVNIINSRKINIKAAIALDFSVLSSEHEELAIDCADDKTYCNKKKIQVYGLADNRRDVFRIRESTHLPKDRANIGEVVWQELDIRNIDFQPKASELTVKGEMSVFCIYKCEDGSADINYYDCILPFTGAVRLDGCMEDDNVAVNILSADKSLITRPDENGELRILDGEIILELEISRFANTETDIINDAYSLDCLVKPVFHDIRYRSFVQKNNVRVRIEERQRMPEGGASAVINSSGKLYIEDVITSENDCLIEGYASVDILYRTAQDDSRIACAHYELPFTEKTDIGIMESSISIERSIGMTNVMVYIAGSGDFDIKCNTVVELCITKNNTDNIIVDMDSEELNHDYLMSLPSIAGYITVEGDTLWSIAKKYCTTVENIKMTNNLTSDEVVANNKLIIIR